MKFTILMLLGLLACNAKSPENDCEKLMRSNAKQCRNIAAAFPNDYEAQKRVYAACSNCCKPAEAMKSLYDKYFTPVK